MAWEGVTPPEIIRKKMTNMFIRKAEAIILDSILLHISVLIR